jgi:homoaconitase
MGAEVGATTSTFPYTSNMQSYLHATGRGPVAQAADEAAAKGFLAADQGAEYDEVIEIVRVECALNCFLSLSLCVELV